VNRHINEVLGAEEAVLKEELPQTFWQRLKSKIEHIGEKPEADEVSEERKRGGEE
jgi:hypothetical protein